MARYDFSAYGSSVYGPGTVVPFLADPISGASLPQGPLGIQCRVISSYSIDVFWASAPASTATAQLTMVRLVRSEVGPPAWETDGDVLVDAPIGNLLRYTDSGLRAATFYYYTIFVFDATVQTWLRAGSTGCVTPNDAFDMGSRLYELVPDFYHALDDNMQAFGPGPLQRFLTLLGFELDVIRTEIESLAWIWDMKRGSAQIVPYALAQYLLEPEPELGYSNQRQLLRAASILYAIKGSAVCVRVLCATVTGWATTVLNGLNLLVDNLDAQFDGSVGRWVGTNATVPWRAGDGSVNAPNGRGMVALTASGTSNPSMSLYANDPRYSGVPVIQGQAYGISVLVRSATVADNVTIAVQFWDVNGAAVGPLITGSPVTPHLADWGVSVSVAVTAPAGAFSMSLRVATAGIVAGHVTYVSSVMVQPLATAGAAFVAYQPARDIRIVVTADQINEVNNPKFAADTNSWAVTVGGDVSVAGGVLTRITSDEPPPVSSSTAGQLVATAAGQGAWTACTEITPDVYYTGSMWVKVVSGAGVIVVVRDKITNKIVSSTPLTGAGWVDTELSLVTGIGAYEMDISIVALGATTVRFGAVLLTQGGSDVAYFDGSIASNTSDYLWEGQADASRSHFYRQRTLRSYRFRELLPRFIIGGQTATILYAQPTVNDIYPADDLYPSDTLFPG